MTKVIIGLFMSAWPLASGAIDKPFGPLNLFYFSSPIQTPEAIWHNGNGQVKSFSDYEGNVIVVNMWASWCAPCLKEMPSLDKLQERFKDSGLTVLPINLDPEADPAERIQTFYNKLGITNLGIHRDTKKHIQTMLKPKILPTTYVINRKGEIIGIRMGGADWFGLDAQSAIQVELSATLPQDVLRKRAQKKIEAQANVPQEGPADPNVPKLLTPPKNAGLY